MLLKAGSTDLQGAKGGAVEGNTTITGSLTVTSNSYLGTSSNPTTIYGNLTANGNSYLGTSSNPTTIYGNALLGAGLQLGYSEVASGSAPSSITAGLYLVASNGISSSTASFTLPPSATNGTEVILTTADPDGCNELTTGFTFSQNTAVRFMKTSDGWKSEF
jgi:hypothetical protein